MPRKFATPEEAHDALIDAIDYELDTYGPSSLADVVTSLISARQDEDAPKPEDEHCLEAEREYEGLAWRLAKSPLNKKPQEVARG